MLSKLINVLNKLFDILFVKLYCNTSKGIELDKIVELRQINKERND